VSQKVLLYVSIVCHALVSNAVQNSCFLKVVQENRLIAFVYYATATPAGFFQSALDFPAVLSHAALEHVPVIMCVPQEYHGYSALDANAYALEGVRVALAWASAYFRFQPKGPIDIHVVTYTDSGLSHTAIKKIVTALVHKKRQLSVQRSYKHNTQLNPELLFQAQFYKAHELLKKSFRTYYSIHYDILEYTQEYQEHEAKSTKIIKPEFYAPNKKRVVITGGAGFIGSFLARELVKRDYQVIVLDNLLCSTEANIQDLQQHDNFYFCNCDVTESFTVLGPVDYIIHAASVPSPAFYYTHPLETLRTGLHATKHTLELAKEKGACYVFTSTSEVYGDPEINPQPEWYPGYVSPFGKRSQYDQSKRGGETLIKYYFEQFGLDVRIVRIFNTYGPGMSLYDGRVIPNFIKALLTKTPLPIYGTGGQTRSFAYITDTADGILKVLFAQNIACYTHIKERVFNIGNSQEWTINDLAKFMIQYARITFGIQSTCVYHHQDDNSDPKIRRPDITRAQKILGYQPQVTLEQGLKQTLLFFKHQ
jgi:dTDP-glucose 4,6-dehydratase